MQVRLRNLGHMLVEEVEVGGQTFFREVHSKAADLPMDEVYEQMMQDPVLAKSAFSVFIPRTVVRSVLCAYCCAVSAVLSLRSVLCAYCYALSAVRSVLCAQ
jgi:hypothetical protein